MRGKKAVGVGQVFVFIIAAITFALIMIFGYKAIVGFLDQGENVEFFQFKQDLEGSIKKIYTEFGSVRVVDYRLPLQYQQICFVDVDKDYTSHVLGLCQKDVAACTVWETAEGTDKYNSVDENVFLKDEDGNPSPVKIKVFRIQIKDPENPTQEFGYLCKDIHGGTFSLRLEGKGSKTSIFNVTRP